MYYEVSRVKKQLLGKKIYSYRFSYKFASILFLPFLTNQKQESGFQEVAGLVTRNIYLFCLHRVALYFKVMPNSIDFIWQFPHMLFQFVSLQFYDVIFFLFPVRTSRTKRPHFGYMAVWCLFYHDRHRQKEDFETGHNIVTVNNVSYKVRKLLWIECHWMLFSKQERFHPW